jgi:hypothetical protein
VPGILRLSAVESIAKALNAACGLIGLVRGPTKVIVVATSSENFFGILILEFKEIKGIVFNFQISK